MSTCQPFAIMRLTHEAIRRGLEALEQTAENKAPVEDLESAFQSVWNCIQLHAAQEDKVFYGALEERHPGLTAPFTQEHDAEAKQIEFIEKRLKSSQHDAEVAPELYADILSFIQTHREHLKHEEEILMELLPRTFTYPESVEVVRKILAYDMPVYREIAPWILARLQGGQRETYLGMVQGCCAKEDLPDVLESLKPVMSKTEVEELQAVGRIG